MLEDFREAAWFLSEKEYTLTGLTERISSWWAPILNAQKVELKIDLDQNLVTLPLSLLQKKNIYLICKEAINNSLKYSGCSCIFIKFSLQETVLSFKISDDGFYRINDRDEANGLKNIKDRMLEINGSAQFELTANKNVTIEGKIVLNP